MEEYQKNQLSEVEKAIHKDDKKTQNRHRDEFGKFIPGFSGNPEGIGGFKDNPHLVNRGGRPKNAQRFGYWLQFFKDMTAKEFREYGKQKSEDEMYVAEVLAYQRVLNSRTDLGEYKDLADRTEGKPAQQVNLNGEMSLYHLLGDLTGEDNSQEPTEDN